MSKMPKNALSEKNDVRPAGRPRKFDRANVMNLAMNAFWQHGYESTSVSELHQAMGIRRSSFYNTFKDRESVFLEVIDNYMQGLPTAKLSRIEPGKPVLPVLRDVIEMGCFFWSNNKNRRGCLLINSLDELVGHHPTLGPEMTKRMDMNVARLKAILAQAVEQGELPADTNSVTLANTVLAFILGLASLSKVITDETVLAAFTSDFIGRMGLAA